MKMRVLLICQVLCSFSTGKLNQLNSALICPSDSIFFKCETHDNAASQWRVRTAEGYGYRFNLNPGSHGVGYSREIAFIRAEVIFRNSSSFISLVIINNATYYNGTYVSCNEDEITLTLNEIGEQHLPSTIVFTQLGFSYNYSVSWSLQVPREVIVNYNISLNPKPEYGLDHITTNDNYVTLRLNNNSDLVMKLSILFCTGTVLSRDFHVGRCPFLTVENAELQYQFESEGNQYNIIKCFDGEQTIIECGANRTWINYTDHNICAKKEVCNYSVNLTQETKVITEKVNVLSIQSNQSCTNLNTYITASISGACVAFTLLIVTASLISIIIMKYKKQEKITVSTNSNNQMYEEIDSIKKQDHYQLTSNTAYGELQKSAPKITKH